ncbi:MAG: MOSC domain-containing protein [Acidimicrobiia bacterium]|nr:MOSC domain-containing protein [Acidimicrobiia bacterium]
MQHLTTAELTAGLDHIRASPVDGGTVEAIVRRPAVDGREELEVGELDVGEGLVGDTWSQRGSKRTDDGSPHPDMQLNIINARAIALMAQTRDRWQLSGDQLHLDLDLTEDNLPPRTRLAIGTAIIEVTDQPHTGCAKFSQRYGIDAARFVNSPEGKQLKLRGINAKVVQAGSVSRGDTIDKL